MIAKWFSKLWVSLSVLLTAALVLSCVGIFRLSSADLIGPTASQGLTLLAVVLMVPSLVRLHLSPLGHLVAWSETASRGEDRLTIRADSRDEVGRMAAVVRHLYKSTRAAMGRLAQAEGAGLSEVAAFDDPGVEVRIRSAWSSWQTYATYATVTMFAATCVVVSLVTPARARGPAARPAVAVVAPTGGASSRVDRPSSAVMASPSLPTSAVRGVTDDAVLLGMSAPFSGSVRSLSEGMKLGLDTAFAEVNAKGGVHGRQVKLVALDNGYDEKRALETTHDLVESRRVFAMVGSVGTPTVKAVLPYLAQHQVLLFGPLTGSPILRKDPPDRYVFNVRSSYDQETSQMVSYLLDVKHVPPRGIVVLAQNDSYGDAGYEGAVRTLRKKVHSGSSVDLLRVGYERNTVDVAEAVSRVMSYHAANQKLGGVRAVIVVATAGASAAFTGRVASLGAIVMNVSFVDAAQLATEFKEHWPGVGAGVIVTQVVPHYESGATGVMRYRSALGEFFPSQSPGFASLEGYVVGTLFVEGLRRAGRDLDTEKIVDALEKIQGLDLGTGASFGFGVSNHQASSKVWATELDAAGAYKPLDAEWME